MNTRLPKLAQTFVALTLLVAASSCGVTPEVPKESAPKAAANETAPGQHGYVRVRGAITAVAGNALTVQTRAGQEMRVNINPQTPVNSVTRAAITDIKPGSYIGTATTPLPDGSLKALEVHIYPEKAVAGDGHGPWDLGPDSSMTSGLVGDVEGSRDRTLTIKYNNGQKKVVVPHDAPIVHIEKGDHRLLKPDVRVFITSTKGADGTLWGRSISAGKDGVTPPM